MARLLLLLYICLPVFASDGKVLFAKGEAVMTLKSKKVRLQKDSNIFITSTVSTDKNSFIVIKLNDGTTLKINENSEVILKQLSAGSTPTEISINKGSSFFNIVKKKIINGAGPLNVITRSASLGVRGTTFFVAVNEMNGNTDTWMCVKEGIVSTTGLSSRQNKLVKSGEGLKISSNERLEDPRFLPWTSGLNWNLEGSDDMENKLDIRDAYEDILIFDYE